MNCEFCKKEPKYRTNNICRKCIVGRVQDKKVEKSRLFNEMKETIKLIAINPNNVKLAEAMLVKLVNYEERINIKSFKKTT